jgi:glycine cleavage system aminomethyltransferase T
VLKRSIALALIEDGRKRMDQHVAAVVHDRAVLARIVQPRFYDVEGTRLNA